MIYIAGMPSKKLLSKFTNIPYRTNKVIKWVLEKNNIVRFHDLIG